MLDPCGHLVCTTCWDARDYSACPICHRRIDLDSPFAQPAPAREPLWDPRPLTLLDVGRDLDATATRVYTDLLARTTPLSPQDREDLVALVRRCGVEQVPAHIPVRETMALIFGTWLEFDLVRPHLKTATDVLRVLVVALGGEADLVKLPKPMPNIPRPIRRFVLQTLEGLPQDQLAEDVRRHARHWKRIGEKLHPYEFQARYPNTALAFAAIRRTRVDDDFTAGAAATVTRERVRLRTFATQLEEALAAQDAELALELAQRRPGELVRRLDHLLRLGAPVVPALENAAPDRRHARPAHRDGLDPRAHPPAPEARLLPARGGDERVRHRRHAPADPAGRHRRRRRRHPAGADRPRRSRGAARHGRARRAPEGPDRPVPAAPRRPPAAHRPAREPAPAAGRGHAAPVPALDAAGRPARGPRPERPALRRRLAHARPVRLHRPALRGRRHALRRPHVRTGPARRVRVRRPGPAGAPSGGSPPPGHGRLLLQRRPVRRDDRRVRGLHGATGPSKARSSTRAPSSSASTCRATPRSRSRRSSTSTGTSCCGPT